MQNEIMKKIDLLVEMSDTNNHYENLKEELDSINKDISYERNKINDIKKTIIPERYIKSSARIIDENIKIGLTNKLEREEKELSTLLNNIEEISIEEEESHKAIEEITTELERLSSFLNSLELKLKTIGSKDKNAYSFYEDLMSETTSSIKENESLLNTKKDSHLIITDKLNTLGEERSKLETQINEDKSRLQETIDILNNKNSYIDEELKESDKEKISKLEEELNKLEDRKTEILEDPAFIGYLAEEAVVEDDITTALKEIKNLTEIVKKRPYMDFISSELEEALEQATSKRDEFASLIDSKNYNGEDKSIMSDRIAYLESKKNTIEEEIDILKDKINKIDTEEVKELRTKVNETKLIKDKLTSDIEDYKKVLKSNNEYKTPRKKALLNAAFHRKVEELEHVSTILSSYQKDLENLVNSSKLLEEKELTSKKEEIKLINKEISEIEKLIMLNSRTEDILALEKDKVELKKLSDEVEKIKNRMKYKTTPDEIYDELELSLQGRTKEEFETPNNSEEEYINLEDYRINAKEKREEKKELEEESIKPAIKAIEEEEEIKPLSRTERTQRLKVVSVEPINETKKEEVVEDNKPTKEKEDITLPFIEEPTQEEVRTPSLEDTAEKELEPLVDTDDLQILDNTAYIDFNDLLNEDK